MRGIRRIIRKNRIILAGFLIVTLTHLVVMLINHCAPFGDNVYARGDNIAQLPGYAAELKRKLINHDSLYYTWKITGGGSFYYIFSYVLCSPLMLPLIFSDIDSFASVLNFCMIAASVLMYITMSVYLAGRPYDSKMSDNSVFTIVCPISYSLLPAFVNAATFYPYLGCFVLMPLVLLGLEKYINNKEWVLYFISLVIMILSNFYIGMICCIFIVLYYLTLEFSDFKHFLRCSVSILMISICAVGVAAIVIIPVVFSTMDGGYGVSEYHGAHLFTNWNYFIKQSMWGTEPVLIGSAPTSYWECNTYIGIYLLMLCIMYFFETKISLNVRIRKFIVLVILFFTFDESTANYIIHIFHYTVGIPNRQSVLVMLYMIIIAEEAGYYILNAKLTSKRFINMIVTSGVMIAIYTMVFLAVNKEININISFIMTVLFIILYLILLTLMFKMKKSKLSVALLSFVVIAEIASNYVMLFQKAGVKDIAKDNRYRSVSELCSNIDDKDIHNVAYNGQDSSVNLGLIYGYNTLQGYSTVIRYGYLHALEQLGIRVTTNIREQGFNSFLNSVFDRKYIIQPTGEEYKYVIRDEMFKNTNSIDRVNNVDLYVNDDVLSPVIVAEGDMNEYSKYLKEYPSHNKDIALANNLLCRELSGISDLVTTASANAITIEDSDNCEAVIYEGYLVLSPEVNGGVYNPSKESSVIVSFIAPQSGEYIVDTTSNCHAGYHEKGETVYVKAQINANDYNRETGVYATDIRVNVLDLKKYKNAYNTMKNNSMNITDYSSDRIEGTLTSEKDSQVFTSIPYDSSWSVYVDGVKKDIKCIGDAFLSFEIDEGKHDVVLRYRPRGLILGIVISCFSMIIFVFILVLKRKTE